MIFERLCKTLTSECLLFPTDGFKVQRREQEGTSSQH